MIKMKQTGSRYAGTVREDILKVDIGVFYVQKLNLSRRAQWECRGENLAGVACVPEELRLLSFWFLLILVLPGRFV